MTPEEIEKLRTNGTLPGRKDGVQCIETHISWVLLTGKYAYKIKKPVSFSFLDFSTLEKRHHYCQRELLLNQRLAKDIYLDVLPVEKQNGGFSIGTGQGEIVDYSVQMIQLPASKQMDSLLRNHDVSTAQMQQLADVIAGFHKHTDIIYRTFNPHNELKNFRDLLGVMAIIERLDNLETRENIENLVEHISNKIVANAHLFQNRIDNGYLRDCHGDLHSRNIFLMEKPVIFDCIEFNDEFRHIDLLNEIAFLYIDLQAHGQTELADTFLNEYLRNLPIIRNEADRWVWHYFLTYRSNVKLKVTALRLQQFSPVAGHHKEINELYTYRDLFIRYGNQVIKEMA